MTSETVQTPHHHRFRVLPKDIGVAIAILIALALGLLVRTQVTGRTTTFQAQDMPFQIAYPAGWAVSTPESEQTLLSIFNPLTDSAVKTQVSVQNTLLDSTSPLDLLTLVNRRIDEHDDLTGYYFIGQREATVGGAPAQELEYAYVVQPISTPGRPALPVVVHAREYIVMVADSVYTIALAAPDSAFADASAGFDAIMQTVKLQ